MKTLNSWLLPFDPRGMSVWGSIACIILAYGLYGVQGQLIEVWPNRCSLIKSQLIQVSSRENEQEGQDPIIHPLLVKEKQFSDAELLKYWVIKTDSAKQTTAWLIPKGDYQEAKIKFNRLKPIWVELVRQAGPNLTLIYEPEQSPIELYKYLMQAKGLKEAQNLIEKQTISRFKLEKLAFTKTPSDLTCHRENMEEELHILVALLLKNTELGLQSLQVEKDNLWLSKRKIANRIHYRVKTWLSYNNSSYGVWSLSWTKDSKQPHPETEKQITQHKNKAAPVWLLKLLKVLATPAEPTSDLMDKIKSISPEVKLID